MLNYPVEQTVILKSKVFIEPRLVWVSELSAGLRTKRLPVRFPFRAHAWVAGQVPSVGGMGETTNPCISHTLMFPSLTLSLKRNKILKKIPVYLQFDMLKGTMTIYSDKNWEPPNATKECDYRDNGTEY